MKKNLFTLLICTFILFSFSSCDLIFSAIGSSNKDVQYLYTINDADSYYNNNWYLFKINTSQDYKIDADATGYIANTSRSAEVDESDSENSIDFSFELNARKENGFSRWNDTELIRKIDEENLRDLNLSAARAAQTAVKSTIQNVSHSVGDEEYFWYADSSDGTKYTYAKEKAVCKYSGTYCEVFFLDNNPIVAKDRLNFRTLGQKFDDIYKKETEILGTNKYESHSDEFIDPKSKITILVTDLYKDATNKQSGGTFGYFSMTDMYKSDYISLDSKSNENQMIYIDSYFYSYDGSSNATINGVKYDLTGQVYSTLVHEFNHLLNFCTKTVGQGLQVTTWYTEMLSMITEDLFSDYLNLDFEDSPVSRLAYYFDYNTSKGFTIWQSGEDVYTSYANCFAYGAYLVRNYGGINLLKQLATNSKVDGESVTAALSALGYKKTFEDTVKEFPLILLNYNKTSGITLNKSFNDFRSDGLGFNAIAMYPYTVKDKYGQDVTISSPPVFKSGKGIGSDLYPTGFSIHTIGKGISQFNYCKPDTSVDRYVLGYIANISGGLIYDEIY